VRMLQARPIRKDAALPLEKPLWEDVADRSLCKDAAKKIAM
jgi:hypothetical protein